MAGGLDEFGLIDRLLAPLAAAYPGARGLTDDVAVITPPPGKVLVVTTDTMVEGVHFPAACAADLVARKLVRVNLSDLASKGAEPFGVTLNLALPPDTSPAWMDAFATGLGQDLAHFHMALLGGDTVSLPGPVCLGLTAFGWADPACVPARSGALAGDDIWVSGTIGDGGAGLRRLDHAWLRHRYDLPQPRLALGRLIAPLATASMDVSDGLLQDLGHICRASHLGAEIRLQAVPLSPDFVQAGFTVTQAVGFGDDYEILFTAPPGQAPALQESARQSRVDITRIGRMIPGQGVTCLDDAGQKVAIARQGWQHFRTDGPAT